MSTVADVNVPARPSERPSDKLPREQLLALLRQMLLIRRFEERTAQSYQQARIGGFCHLYIGQEAVAVGAIAALRPDDPIITAYRDHGHALARGMDPRQGMAEMFGKLAGCAKGKGGSMHMFDAAHHMYGGHAIVAGQCPPAVGIAFAIQYRREDRVCVCFLGDGALNQGAFHEALNLAAIWRLPVIFVVENNMYSMGTHIARGTSCADDLGVKAAAYGMHFVRVDGMDVLEVYDAFRGLAERVRGSTSRALGHGEDAGLGPALVDAQTYRYKGHSMSDPQKYRTKEEVTQYEEQDPIQRIVATLIERGVTTQERIDELDKQARQQVLDAVAFAMQAPETPLDELYTDVYANPYPPFRQGTAPEMLRGDA